MESIDLTQIEDFESDDKHVEWSMLPSLIIQKVARWSGSGFIVEIIVIDSSDDVITSSVTVRELLKFESSQGVLVIESNGHADTSGERLESKVISWLGPITVLEELHWADIWESSSRSVSLLEEGERSRVSDGHDAVLAWRTSDLEWVDGSSWSLSGGD